MNRGRIVVLSASIFVVVMTMFPLWTVAISTDVDAVGETETMDFRYKENTVSVDIPSDSYEKYTSIPILHQGFSPFMYKMVTPEDATVKQMADSLSMITSNMSDHDTAEYVLKFVNSIIHYRSDMSVHGRGEYWQFPIETLYLGTGDCEDFAILYVSLMQAMGFETLLVMEPEHVSTAVLVDAEVGETTVEYHGKIFVTADPTNGRGLGYYEPVVNLLTPSDGMGTLTYAILLVDIIILSSTMLYILNPNIPGRTDKSLRKTTFGNETEVTV